MNKSTSFLTLLLLFCLMLAKAQPTFYSQAPVYDNSTSNLSAPNGSSGHTYMRAVMLVKPGELTGMPNNTITSFGFALLSGNVTFPGAGDFTLHLQNTADVTYTKSTSFSGAIAGMTMVYASTMTVPVTTGSANVTVSLTTPFVYTGGGIYVAYDWYQPGPGYSSQLALYQCNSTGLAVGGARNGGTALPAADLLTTSAFRPAFLFGAANTFTNEFSVIGIRAPGKVPAFNSSHQVGALIKNNSTQTQTNVVVTLNASGANPVSITHTIASLAPGATTVVAFTPYVPTNAGISNLSVSVPSDENNANNSATFTQSVTCRDWSMSPPGTTYSAVSVGFPTGNGGVIAVSYSTATNTMLTGIRLGVSTHSSAVGTQICGGLFDASGTILATTQTITVTAGMLNTLVTHTFSTPQFLTAGTNYYFGFIQVPGSASSYPIGGSGFNTIVLYNSIYVNIPIAGGAINTSGNYGYYGIEAQTAPGSSLAVSPPSIACGNQAVLSATTTASSYSWTAGPVNSNYSVTPTSNSVYTLMTGSGNCIFSGTVSVSVTPITVTASAGSPTVCTGGTVDLFAGGATNYAWNVTPAVNTASFNASPSITTVYTVQGSDPNGCSNTATVQVYVIAFTDFIIASPGTVVCMGNAFTATATSGSASSYVWNLGASTLSVAAISITPTTNNTYTLTVTGNNGCVASQTVAVSVRNLPTLSTLAQQAIVCIGQTNTLIASGANTYSWNGSGVGLSPGIVVTPTLTGNMVYTVTGADAYDCMSTATVSFYVDPCLGVLDEMTWSDQAKLFPNPTSDMVSLVLKTPLQNGEVRVVNMLGELLMQKKSEGVDTKFDLSKLTSGIYQVVILENGKIVGTTKVVKQ